MTLTSGVSQSAASAPVERRALVLALIDLGMPKRRIARDLGLSRARVREIAVAARGGPSRRRPRR